MADFKLDENGDIAIENNTFVIIDGDEAIVQHLKFRLQFFKGEFFLNTKLGIPYYQDIFVKNANLVLIRNIFREGILETPGIAELEVFNLDFDGETRRLKLYFVASKTDGGTITFDQEFEINV